MTAMAVRRRESTLGMFDAVDPLAVDFPQTPISFIENPALASIVGVDSVGETDSSGRHHYETFFLGDSDLGLVWCGTGRFLLSAVASVADHWSVDLRPHGGELQPDSLVDQVVDSVEWMTGVLGVPERDVLAAAGVSDRTFYNWKRHRGTTPRRGSQAQLWALKRSVRDIADALEDQAPSWLKSDTSLRDLLLAGAHGQLAALAVQAAAAEWGVALPSGTDDRFDADLPVVTDDNARGGARGGDSERLKQFRTQYPVVYTHTEQGHPLTQATGLEAAFYEEEAEDDVVLIDLDD